MKSIEDIERMLFRESLAEFRQRLAYDPRLERLLIEVEMHYSDFACTASTAAEKCEISKGRLNQLLALYSSFSFRELLTAYRIYEAVVIFLSRHERIVDVAAEVGMNLSNFERSFRRLLQTSPREFRRSCRSAFMKQNA